MCSYGGKIHPRPHGNQLSYVGGETKILSVDRNVKFSFLLSKLIALCDCDAISFKYQLPGEDLDALISVTNDDDLEHLMHEYDRLCRVSAKPARLRVFIFPTQNPGLNSSARSFGSDEGKTDKERFVDALNSAPILTAPQQPAEPHLQPPAGNMDFLFGFEKAAGPLTNQPTVGRIQELEDPVVLPGLDERLVGSDPIQMHIQDLQMLRIEEQQVYQRKNDDNLSGGFTGGEYYKVPEKISQVPVTGGVSYWTDKQFPGGVFPTSTINNEQPVYMIPPPTSAYHSPMMRPVNGAPNQGYYTVQRMPSEQMYSMIPQGAVPSMAATPQNVPPQKMTGYSDGLSVVRTTTTGGVGMVAEGGYAQVMYSAAGSVMGTPAPASVQAAQYQAMAAAVSAEAGGKVVAKATQSSV